MLKFAANSDITKVESGIVAQGVNCQGVMGSGVALAIRKRWPVVYDYYKHYVGTVEAHERDRLLGSCSIIRINDQIWVANCFTQFTYGGDGARYADPDAVKSSLEFVFTHAQALGTVVHAPRIASDLGGLDWATEVLPIFEALNNEYDDVNVVIHSL